MASEPHLRGQRARRTAAQSGAEVASGLLHATLACVRCKDFIADGDLDCAHIELLALSAALAEVDELTLDDDGIRECQSLRRQEANLQVFFELPPNGRAQ